MHIQLAELCGEVITDEGYWDFLSSTMAPLTLGNSVPGVPPPPNVIPAFIEELAEHAWELPRTEVTMHAA